MIKHRYITVSEYFAVHVGLRTWLEQRDGHSVVTEAMSGADAVRYAREHRPDFVIIDDEITDTSPRELIRALRDHASFARVIVVGPALGGDSVRSYLDAGALGMLGPGTTVERLHEAIAAIDGGREYVDPVLASVLFGPDSGLRISPREVEIVEQLMEGRQNKLIALDLGISEETVKTHVRSLMRKLDAFSRTEIVVKALQRSIVRLPTAA